MKLKRKNLFIFILLGIFSSCHLTKNVPNNYYLLQKNNIEIPKGTKVDKTSIKNVIKQTPNRKTLGLPLRLATFNAIDSTKTAQSKVRRLIRYKEVNKNRIARQDRMNEKRIQKALRKKETSYKEKVIALKDTINPKPTFRERLKYRFGESPVIFDSSLMVTSKDQLELYMKKKGYFNAKVEAKQVKIQTEKKKTEVLYSIQPGELYFVDSVYLKTDNPVIDVVYNRFLKYNKKTLVSPFRFDSEQLKTVRRDLSKFMRNFTIYGFKESYVTFEVDTLRMKDNKDVKIALIIADRMVGKPPVSKPFNYTYVENVYFHLLDTLSYKGKFKSEMLDPKGIHLNSFDNVPTFDTLRYIPKVGRNTKFSTATFLYNGKLTTSPKLIEFQNLLEEGNVYRDNFVSQSYSRLMNLNVFNTVKPEIIENEDNSIDVHYYMIPKKKNSFSFDPKGTNDNGFLGISASINYLNRNLFRKGYRLTISFSGGFETLPDVFSKGKDKDDKVLDNVSNIFNNFEYGPTAKLEIPGLFPIPLAAFSKNQNSSATFSLAYNSQSRTDFNRKLFQWNYSWKFSDAASNQIFTIGIPIIGGIQFVNINKTAEFQQRLEEQNDLFLLNAYSNQAVYKDVAVSYTFRNPDIREGNVAFSYRMNFDMAGMVMSGITKNKPENDDGFKEFLGQRYSQFLRLDNELKLHQYISEKTSVHYRIQVGGGIPLRNNGLTLPFDYSFFGGGSNDNRGFRARTLGPGVYKYYLDTTRTLTQMGDMRLGASLEYRFKMSKIFEGGIFTDIGNVWTYNEDANRPGGQISKDFYKQLVVSGGLGLRLDFTYVIVRLDMGLPIRNPALPKGSQWIFQNKQGYIQEGIDKWGTDPNGEYYYKDYMANPFKPAFHIAIGYPF